MIQVFVNGPAPDVEGLAEFGLSVQERFCFARDPVPDAVSLRLADHSDNGLFAADRVRGVTISTAQSEGIAHYLGITRSALLLICSMLGLTQWRALALNPLLRAEDFIHCEPATCAFARQPTLPDYALAFEHRYVCRACREFFHCLGADPEVLALQDLLRSDRLAA